MKKLTLFITILTGIFLAPFALAETINVNIGTRTSEEGIVSTVTGNDAGIFTLTLNNTVNSSILAYDKLIDSASSSYWITNVSNNIITVEDRLGAFTSPATDLFQSMRAYSTITLWEADLDNLNLYSSSADAIGNVYNDSVYDEAVTIDGGKTIPLNSITLTVPEGQRHNGTAGTGARIVRTAGGNILTVSVDSTVSFLEINANAQAVSRIIDSNATNVFARMLLWNTNHTTTVAAVTNNIGKTLTVLNSFIFRIHKASGTGNVTALSGGGAAATFLNVTVHDVKNDGGAGTCTGVSVNSKIVKNVISTDPSGTTSGTKAAFTGTGTTATNASSDDTAPGAGSLINISSANQFVSTVVGSEDLHLKAGAESIDAGTDLATTPTGVNFDIDNQNHGAGAVWDIGADEYTNFIWIGGKLRFEGGLRFE